MEQEIGELAGQGKVRGQQQEEEHMVDKLQMGTWRREGQKQFKQLSITASLHNRTTKMWSAFINQNIHIELKTPTQNRLYSVHRSTNHLYHLTPQITFTI